ncbi:amino acid adenylation domain-containing protein [Sphingomonas fuzhouensis]|uniref:amino acid adenylation domain-containing protein n=1 Tax=Sphingomonas fuzhouensis TaxID=3106033 RepID=UPI002AFFAD93|nr:amino acid adenylation domain-containing protein [Sphingomonas sp. SGZ-02]
MLRQQETTGHVTTRAWRTLPDIFARHAWCNPDAPAVTARGQRRSYGELAARVDQLAARLAYLLADDHPLIGVCLARDVDLPAWLLAILKIGAAYLPIDPSTPPSRLAHIMEDARPALIVANRCHADIVAGLGVAVTIAEDESEPVMMVPTPAITPATLAYVIFTSGSTGRPKGVEIEHGSLVALLATMAASPGFHAGETMLGLTRISFDLSVPDLFLPFYVGGSLALVDLEDAADPARLAAAFAAHRPDLAQATPSTWRALVEHGWSGLPGLRILAGGEALTRSLADRLLLRCDELWNIYGPTETTVWSTACHVTPSHDAIPIGWPMSGISVHVTDSDLRPVPPGKVGEIVIGGTGVARGYRNRPELTAERFVRMADGSRVYRTGDLGRFDERGALYCLGRIDDQVKVRGFRIELGDVEAAMSLHPDIAWSAVRLWTDPSGEALLVGYAVPRERPLGTRAIKTFLASRLPAYMIPDRITTLSSMPLTPNGKIDRAALPDPFAAAPPALPAEATDAIDRRLAAIWSDLLNIGSIAADDDFFDLGGYSLMTVRLARRIETAFGVRLALIDLMRHSTLSAMAARIALGDQPADRGMMLLNPEGTRPPLFWLDTGPLMRTILRHLSADQPVLALNIDPRDEDALGAGALSIAAVAARLKEHLLSTQPVGPFRLGGWCRWGIVAYELARQLAEEGRAVDLLVLLDADRPRRRLIQDARTWLSHLRPHLRHGKATPSGSASVSQRVEQATHRYVARPYDGDVLSLEPTARRTDTGWGAVVRGRLTSAKIPGDHETMVRGSAAPVLAAALDRALAPAPRHADAGQGSIAGDTAGRARPCPIPVVTPRPAALPVSASADAARRATPHVRAAG